MCASCQFAKQKKRPTKDTSKTNRSDKELMIKTNDLFPGQKLSVDHYQSAVPEEPTAPEGATTQKTCLMVVPSLLTMPVERSSCVTKNLSASDSIKSMLKLEREAAESGVKLQSLHTDNVTFSSTKFMAHLTSKKQPVTFSGVGTAHQNAVAERAIQTITYMARRFTRSCQPLNLTEACMT